MLYLRRCQPPSLRWSAAVEHRLLPVLRRHVAPPRLQLLHWTRVLLPVGTWQWLGRPGLHWVPLLRPGSRSWGSRSSGDPSPVQPSHAPAPADSVCQLWPVAQYCEQEPNIPGNIFICNVSHRYFNYLIVHKQSLLLLFRSASCRMRS